jgi:hypothetical protein
MRVESTNGVKFLFFSDEGRACARRKMEISHSWWAFTRFAHESAFG